MDVFFFYLNANVQFYICVFFEKKKKTLIYTHPGYPAYMGMNSHGLAVLWQYIDNGERNLENGVPTVVLIREMLTKSTLTQAVTYLREVPHMIPNHFLLSQVFCFFFCFLLGFIIIPVHRYNNTV